MRRSACRSPGPRATDQDVDGTNAQRSGAASRSSPAAAQRCAAGAGLDGDAALRSTIRRAVARNPSRQIAEFHQGGRAPGDLRYTKNLHQLDGHDPIEQAFAKLKALLRKAAARTVEALWDIIGVLMQAFRPDEPANYFANSGYGQP